MITDSKVCLTTYVYGVKYQNYIPLLIYSCYKAYPEYDIVLFIHGKLDESVKKSIYDLELTNKVVIRENIFNDCPNMSAIKSQALRWVIWDDSFNEYDFVYTVDIDMIYIREPEPLHIQHKKHMCFLGLPISNVQREIKHNPLNLRRLYNRVNKIGIYSIKRYLSTCKIERRTSGLHFVDVERYYSLFTDDKRNKYKELIYTGQYLSNIMTVSAADEILLTNILEDIGVDCSKLGIQRSDTTMLDFSNSQRLEFRPHHGIHLGIFRVAPEDFSENFIEILNSPAYNYYVNEFKDSIITDTKFIDLINSLNSDVKVYFNRLFEYYNIKM